MRRWMSIIGLCILVILLGSPASLPTQSVHAAQQRVVLFEGFYSPT